MSDVIRILERLGEDSTLRHAGSTELVRAFAGESVSPESLAAVLRADRRELETLAGALANVCCMIHAPDDDEQPTEEEAPGRSDDDEPDTEEKPEPSRSPARRALS